MQDIGKITKTLSFFFNDIKNITEIPIGNINRTYLLELKTPAQQRKVVAQLINSDVFKIRALSSNLNLIDRLSSSNKILGSILPVYIKFQGKVVVTDQHGHAWKFTEYVENGFCGRFPRSELDCFHAGRTLAIFHKETRSLNPRRLRYSIPNFFQPERRMRLFTKALKECTNSRRHEVERLLGDILYLKTALRDHISELARFPRAFAHNDTKFENFIITKTDAILIDHDLVQPGTEAYDVGDFLRTICFDGPEDETGHTPKLNYLDAACEGLKLANYRRIYSKAIKVFSLAPAIVTFILSLRFLTDYLAGDKYFRIWRKRQNFDRGVCQIERAKMLLEISSRIKL